MKLRYTIFLMWIWLGAPLTVCANLPDTVVVIPPGTGFTNHSNITWFAMSRNQLEKAVIAAESLSECEKELMTADNKIQRHQQTDRLKNGIIVTLILLLGLQYALH